MVKGKERLQLKIGVEKVVEALHEDDDNAESDHSACYGGDYPVDGGSETRPTEPDICQFSEFRAGYESRDPMVRGREERTRTNHPQKQCLPRYTAVDATPV